MAKDSQVDKKEVLKQKANGNEISYASEEGKNKTRNAKKQSIKREGFSSDHKTR